MKKISTIFCLAFLFSLSISVSAQTKSCSKMSIEECAKKMGMSVEECKKMCPGLSSTRVASASFEKIVDVPSCCYQKLTSDGKACCAKYSTALASASKVIDVDGNEIKMKSWGYVKKQCVMPDGETRVASVIMVRDKLDAPSNKPIRKKGCSMTCLGKKATKA